MYLVWTITKKNFKSCLCGNEDACPTGMTQIADQPTAPPPPPPPPPPPAPKEKKKRKKKKKSEEMEGAQSQPLPPSIPNQAMLGRNALRFCNN